MLASMRWCLVGCGALSLAACFGEAPDVGDAEATGASTSVSSTSVGSASGATSMSSASGSMTSSEPTSGTTESGDDVSSEPVTTTDGTTSIAMTSSFTSAMDSGSTECHLIDFETAMPGCVNGELALPVGLYQVNIANSGFGSNPGPCVESVDDGDFETAPLNGQYVWLEAFSSTPITFTFTVPVYEVSFLMGPHHAEGGSASLSICANTLGACDTTLAYGDETTSGELVIDLEGATALYVYLTKGVANLGVDDLQVCF